MRRRVMITGAAGQLGFELQRAAPAGTEILALDIEQLDLTDAAAVEACVAEQQPSLIINCAAYTAVDQAESQPDLAEAVNVTAVKALATAAKQHKARMIHISTDFVFGAGNGVPWTPSDLTDPQSVYGRTKRDGERAVLNALGSNALVIRTAWLYSAHGGNFVKTMLRLMAERDEVRVIADQIGTPTWASSFAHTIWAAVEQPAATGILHWTDAGVASWYDFAVSIQEEALVRGLLTSAVPVRAIPTSEYPKAARRPSYSVLDKSETTRVLGITPLHWQANLRLMLDEMANA